jgi:hypothetical protein
LDKYSVPQVVYNIDIDPHYASGMGISLAVGDKVTIVDSDLGINSLIRISGIEYPLVNPYKIKATIAEFVPYTMQQQIIKTTIANSQNTDIVDRINTELSRLNKVDVDKKAPQDNPIFISGSAGGWTMESDAIFIGTKHAGDGYAASPGDLTLAADGSIHGKYFYLNADGYSQIAGTEMPHLIDKQASDNLRHSHDAVANNTSQTYAKMKTITFTNGVRGILRVKFDVKLDAAETGVSYGKIYKNGVAIGTEQTNGTTDYVTKSEDLTDTWLPGDTIELYGKTFTEGEHCYVKDFRLYYDDNPVIAVTAATGTP